LKNIDFGLNIKKKMRIAIFGNTYRAANLQHIKLMLQYFDDSTNVLLFEHELYDYMMQNGVCCTSNIEVIYNDDFVADIALSIGGDGTFLNTAARVGKKLIPILGINTGRLGFLAALSGDEIEEALKMILEANYDIEERSLIKVQLSNDFPLEYPYALNDVAILKQDSASMIGINTSLNGLAVHTYQADGLVIATPTGSTAYSLSVGGPLLVPETSNILLSPVASHSLNVRPLVIPDTWVVDLDVNARTQNFQLSIDGRTMVLSHDVKVRISKASFNVRVIRPKNSSFFDTLKMKLMWGMDKRSNL
jgi:NAD+ kinase